MDGTDTDSRNRDTHVDGQFDKDNKPTHFNNSMSMRNKMNFNT